MAYATEFVGNLVGTVTNPNDALGEPNSNYTGNTSGAWSATWKVPVSEAPVKFKLGATQYLMLDVTTANPNLHGAVVRRVVVKNQDDDVILQRTLYSYPSALFGADTSDQLCQRLPVYGSQLPLLAGFICNSSPDLNYLALKDDTWYNHDTDEIETAFTPSITGEVIAFSPNNVWVAYKGLTGTLHIRNMDTDDLYTFTVSAHTRCMEFSPDNKWLVYVPSTGTGGVVFFDLTDLPPVGHTITGSLQGTGTIAGWVKSATWSPDSNFCVVVGGGAGIIRLYDTTVSPPVRITDPVPFDGTSAQVGSSVRRSCAWSPDGAVLAVFAQTDTTPSAGNNWAGGDLIAFDMTNMASLPRPMIWPIDRRLEEARVPQGIEWVADRILVVYGTSSRGDNVRPLRVDAYDFSNLSVTIPRISEWLKTQWNIPRIFTTVKRRALIKAKDNLLVFLESKDGFEVIEKQTAHKYFPDLDGLPGVISIPFAVGVPTTAYALQELQYEELIDEVGSYAQRSIPRAGTFSHDSRFFYGGSGAGVFDLHNNGASVLFDPVVYGLNDQAHTNAVFHKHQNRISIVNQNKDYFEYYYDTTSNTFIRDTPAGIYGEGGHFEDFQVPAQLSISPDGNYLAFYRNTVHTMFKKQVGGEWAVVEFDVVPTASSNTAKNFCGWTADSRYFICALSSAPMVAVYDLEGGTPVQISGPTDGNNIGFTNIAVAPDRYEFTCSTSQVAGGPQLRTFTIDPDTNTCNFVHTMPVPAGFRAGHSALHYLQNGRFLAALTDTTGFIFWEMTGANPGTIYSLDYTADSAYTDLIRRLHPELALSIEGITRLQPTISSPETESNQFWGPSPNEQFIHVGAQYIFSGASGGSNGADIEVSDFYVTIETEGTAENAIQLGSISITEDLSLFQLSTPTNLQAIATGGNRALVSWDWAE